MEPLEVEPLEVEPLDVDELPGVPLDERGLVVSSELHARTNNVAVTKIWNRIPREYTTLVI